MAESKKARMESYWEDNPEATSSEVAAEFDTNPSYARKCKPSTLRGNTQNAPGREIQQNQASGLAEPEVSNESEPEENPLSSLVIEDSHDEYECSECGARVEYLQDECHECSESLVWARGVGE